MKIGLILIIASNIIFHNTVMASCRNATVGCFIDPNGPHEHYIGYLFDESHKIGMCFHWLKGCTPCHYSQKDLNGLCNSKFEQCDSKCQAVY